jgi:hypothetical protein
MTNKVYILFVYDGERFNITGVYSTLAAAEKDASPYRDWPYTIEAPYIEEHVVLPVKEG